MKNNLICNYCNFEMTNCEVWILKNIPNFTNRSLTFGYCPVCNMPNIALTETRISDNKIFVNKTIKGADAVKTLAREKRRIISRLFKLTKQELTGFIYGINKEINHKKITKIKQYSCDLKSNSKAKCKEIVLRNKEN